MFYNYLRPFTSLDEGLYALAYDEDVRCLTTLVRSFKLIEVYIEHGVTALDSYLMAPRFRATIEEITDEPGSIVANRTEKMLLLTWHESNETTKEPVCDSIVPISLPQHDSSTPRKDSVYESITPRCMPDSILTSPTDESLITYTQLSGVQGVDTQSHVLPIIQSQFKVSTQKPIVAEVNTQVPIVEDVETQEFNVKDVVLEDYSSEDASADDDDDVDEDFLVDKENEIVEPDVDVHLFSISTNIPFDNIGVTNIVLDDVLEGEYVNVINDDGFDNDPGNDEETNYMKRRLAELRTKIEGVINANGQWKRNLKLHKNDDVRIRARCDGKVHVFTMSQCTGSTGLNRRMEVVPSGSSDPTTRSKKRRIQGVSENIRLIGALKLSFRACGRDCLGDDIDLRPNSNCTFISDRQKGRCGQAYKDLLWRAAYATNVRNFEKRMLELKTMNPKAHEWLNKIIAEHWARSYFSGRAKSDLLLNNICEVFYGKIVRDRDKLVITLLEYIREYYMKRIVNVQGVIDKCTGPLTPTATRIIESIKKEAHLMKVQWNGANKYQVSGSLGDQNVDKSLLLVEYMKGNILSQDTTNLWDKVLGEVHMSNNIFATQASCPGKEEPLHVNHTETLDTIRQHAKDKVATMQKPVVVHLGLFTVVGESDTCGPGGAGVASQGSSHNR
uniref:Uncharacterized protein n=1 Tax=Tanacetum cinerariifolium TaxID=118510 RepID=A0A6L2LA38_TANCI|nr:hypothetical protein [Tanacetum cinerariifolium]